MSADLGEMENMDALFTQKKMMIAYLRRKMVQQIVSERLRILSTHSEAEPTVRSEDFSRELRDEPGESQPAKTTDDSEARADFWSIQGDFIYRHHSEPRVQLYVPKEETFPIPLKYIDVTRSSHTDLDVLQEKLIDDNWNVDSGKHLSDSWRGFTKFTLLKEKPPKGYTERETDKNSNDYRTRFCVARSMEKLVKPLGIKEKPKLDDARPPRRIYFIDPDDVEYKETQKHEEKTGKTYDTSHAM